MHGYGNKTGSTAIILAAGNSTRLHPLTRFRPKSCLKINGKTNLSRTIALTSAYVDSYTIVAGKNARYLEAELSWVEKERIKFVYEESLSNLGCAASLKAGLSVNEKSDNTYIIEADVVLTEQSLTAICNSKSVNSTLVTSLMKSDDGKLFKDNDDDEIYISNTSKKQEDNCLGKFVGITRLNHETAELILKLIPENSMEYCCSYIQRVLGNNFNIIKVDESTIGELDTPEDYRDSLKNEVFFASDSNSKIPSTYFNSEYINNFLKVKSVENISMGYRLGFDGFWLNLEANIKLEDEVRKLASKIKTEEINIPIILDCTKNINLLSKAHSMVNNYNLNNLLIYHPEKCNDFNRKLDISISKSNLEKAKGALYSPQQRYLDTLFNSSSFKTIDVIFTPLFSDKYLVEKHNSITILVHINFEEIFNKIIPKAQAHIATHGFICENDFLNILKSEFTLTE